MGSSDLWSAGVPARTLVYAGEDTLAPFNPVAERDGIEALKPGRRIDFLPDVTRSNFPQRGKQRDLGLLGTDPDRVGVFRQSLEAVEVHRVAADDDKRHVMSRKGLENRQVTLHGST